MVSAKIVKMCEKVEKLANELNQLTDSGHVRTGYATIVIMKLSVTTAELIYEDLVDRIQQAITRKEEDKSRL
jgi:parvulin-like peptidyl-prolyl isomerase